MAVTINNYNQFMDLLGQKLIDLTATGDTFTGALMGTGHAFTATNTLWSQVSANEITGVGYTSPGQNLTSVTWTESGGVLTWDAADLSWTAGAGGISASDCVLYDNTLTSPLDALCFDIDFDVGATPLTAGDGTDFIVRWNASGIFTV